MLLENQTGEHFQLNVKLTEQVDKPWEYILLSIRIIQINLHASYTSLKIHNLSLELIHGNESNRKKNNKSQPGNSLKGDRNETKVANTKELHAERISGH